MDAKLDWMKLELNEEGYFPSIQAIERVISGNIPEFFEDSMIDFILELNREWESL